MNDQSEEGQNNQTRAQNEDRVWKVLCNALVGKHGVTDEPRLCNVFLNKASTDPSFVMNGVTLAYGCCILGLSGFMFRNFTSSYDSG